MSNQAAPFLAALLLASSLWPAAAVAQQAAKTASQAEADEVSSVDEAAADSLTAGKSPSLDSSPSQEPDAEPAPRRAGGTAGTAPPTQRVVKDPALDLEEPRTYRLNVVARVEAPEDSDSLNVVVTAPIPMDWPEQQVRFLSQKVTAGGKLEYSVKLGQCATMKYSIGRIGAGESASVELLFEITRYRTQFTLEGDELSLPHGPPSELREQFRLPAPGLEMKHPKIVSLTEHLRHEHEDEAAWSMVKVFWQWTRDNVDFKNGDFRGALFAVEQHCGDCEEMSALFVSMCRLSGVVARSVWVEGHNYPEFYLLDKKGKGHWIPAQVVGPAWFGEMTEYRPIFQKGDRFYDPFRRQYVRYTPQTVKADGKDEPKLFIEHQILADSDINGPTYKNSK